MHRAARGARGAARRSRRAAQRRLAHAVHALLALLSSSRRSRRRDSPRAARPPTNADYMHHATRRRYYARTSHAGLDERTPDITVLALCSHHGHGRVDTVASSLVVSYATRLGTTRGVARRRRRALRYGAAVRDSENESWSHGQTSPPLSYLTVSGQSQTAHPVSGRPYGAWGGHTSPVMNSFWQIEGGSEMWCASRWWS